MPVIASRSDLRLVIGLVIMVLLAPLIPAYLYFTFEPLSDMELVKIEGHLKGWKENSLGRASDIYGGTRSDLHIFIHEDEETYVVGEDLYHSPDRFNASAFKKNIQPGDALVIKLLRNEMESYVMRDIYGLASNGTVYLDIEDAAMDREESHLRMLFILITMAIVCPLLGYILWREIRKYQREKR